MTKRLYHNRIRWLLPVIILTFLLLSSVNVLAFAGQGGYITEKLLDRAGTAASSLIIAMAGTASSYLDIGISPYVSTSEATDVLANHATLHGSVTDMRGLPLTYAYFEYGESIAYGSTTPLQPITSVSDYSTTITGLVVDKTIHFRAVVIADGKLYGSDKTFLSGSTTVVWGWYKLIIPLLVLAALAVSYSRDAGLGDYLTIIVTGVVLYTIAVVVS